VNTTNYRANYFVINGMGGREAMEDRAETAIDGTVGQSALVRILNAGQYPQTFHFHANHVQVLSVNGVRRTAPFKLLDVVSVPPLGTMEVLFVLNQPGSYPMHNHTAQMETANGAYLNGVGTAIYIAP
jgi:FtsP/CotA-like multicopper oxidase with cupredoxin domain